MFINNVSHLTITFFIPTLIINIAQTLQGSILQNNQMWEKWGPGDVGKKVKASL